MVFVALAAINLGAIRAWHQYRLDGNTVNNWVEVLTYGILPMANLLAVGVITVIRRPSPSPSFGVLWYSEQRG